MNVNAVMGGGVAATVVAATIAYGVALQAPDATPPDQAEAQALGPGATESATADLSTAPHDSAPSGRTSPGRPPDLSAASAPGVGQPSVAGPMPQPTPSPPDEMSVARPVLDLVRVDAAGGALVAGSGPASSVVVLRLDGVVVASTPVDRNGSFVSLFDLPAADVPRVLTLEAQTEDGTVTGAADSVIVAPVLPRPPAIEAPPRAETDPTRPVDEDRVQSDVASLDPEDAMHDAASAALPAMDESGTTAVAPPVPSRPDRAAPPEAVDLPETETDVAGLSPTTPGAAPEISASPGRSLPEAPRAPKLIRTGPDGLEVIPSGTPTLPEVVQDLGIEVIAYDVSGDVQLAGRAQTDTELRIYLDNQPIQSVRVGPDGEWSAPLSDVATGIYTLRIDELDESGAVTARVETPFQRTAPEIAAQARRDGASAITVQTGYTLWALSEGYFGSGTQYVQLFEMNRDQIRDPNLIYPGQVFRLPAEE